MRLLIKSFPYWAIRGGADRAWLSPHTVHHLEGIVVSPRDESLMAAIIEGKVSIAEQGRRLVEQYKKQNTLI